MVPVQTEADFRRGEIFHQRERQHVITAARNIVVKGVLVAETDAGFVTQFCRPGGDGFKVFNHQIIVVEFKIADILYQGASTRLPERVQNF